MNKGINLLVLAGLIIAIVLNSLFVIDEKQDGIVFQFGEAIKSDLPTGLNFKLPIISGSSAFWNSWALRKIGLHIHIKGNNIWNESFNILKGARFMI